MNFSTKVRLFFKNSRWIWWVRIEYLCAPILHFKWKVHKQSTYHYDCSYALYDNPLTRHNVKNLRISSSESSPPKYFLNKMQQKLNLPLTIRLLHVQVQWRHVSDIMMMMTMMMSISYKCQFCVAFIFWRTQNFVCFSLPPFILDMHFNLRLFFN